jgi:hypothetical protein
MGRAAWAFIVRVVRRTTSRDEKCMIDVGHGNVTICGCGTEHVPK